MGSPEGSTGTYADFFGDRRFRRNDFFIRASWLHRTSDLGIDGCLPMVDDSSQPTKGEANPIGIVDRWASQQLIENVQVIVIVTREIVAQHDEHLIECVGTGGRMRVVIGLAVQGARNENGMRRITRVTDLLDGIQ